MTLVNKLWLIDDDSLFRQCSNILLQRENFAEKTELLESAYVAIEKLNDDKVTHPDVIFVDLNMPIMNGWEFINEVIHNQIINFDKTRIFILSSSVDPNDLKKAESYKEISGFLHKPLASESVINLIKELILSG